MCGIFGCIKNCNNNADICKLTLIALNLLKNRGYDSCGIFLKTHNKILNLNNHIIKYGVDGEILNNYENTKDIFMLLENKIINLLKTNNIIETEMCSTIGHTRWATHGMKNDLNSHPHMSMNKSVTLVHNGIISNYMDIKKLYLKNYIFKSDTDTEVIANLIDFFIVEKMSILEILKKITNIMIGTWACIINIENDDNLYFIKNENPLLIGTNGDITMLTSEPTGFMNNVDEYYLLRDKTYGFCSIKGKIIINGEYTKLNLIKSNENELILSNKYKTWMHKEIYDQININVLTNPVNNLLRYNYSNVLLNYDFIKECKYLYIIACGSSYYAGLIASNYFRCTKAFEFVNLFDGGEFTEAHLSSIKNPEKDLLVIIISQSGETRDLNIATTICREYSSNRKNILKKNDLLNNDNINTENNTTINFETKTKTETDEIKILGIINVMGSLISRRTIDNLYTNCGRENSVASTKSCTSQIIACLLLAIYKSELNNSLNQELKMKFLSSLNNLKLDIIQTLELENKIEKFASILLTKNIKNLFILGKDEFHGVALEGALKIKEIAYIHAEGFHLSSLKHGPYALIEKDTPIIIIYKKNDHFIKSVIEEVKTRGAYVLEISPFTDNGIKLPHSNAMTSILSVISLQLLAYHLSILQNINPDQPRNLAKVVTVD
jgi:glutamine---fructose-6-phosphate transaminase (isomerizing)